MNSASPTSAPRTAPGSHNPDFTPENPALVWVRENRGFVVMLILALGLGLSFNYYYPKYQHQKQESAWNLYASVMNTPGGPFAPENIEHTLAQARENDQIYAPILLTGVQVAISRQDSSTLQTLIGEIERTQQAGGEWAQVPLPGSDQETLLGHALTLAKAALAGEGQTTFTNPEPPGPRVTITLTVNETDTYDITVGLYPEVAPKACEAFLAAVKSGIQSPLEGKRSGPFGLRFSGLGTSAAEDSAPPGLDPEIQWGYFHTAGALSLPPIPGTTGELDPTQIEITLKDAFHLDTRSTVFGQIIEGLDNLQTLELPSDPSADPIKTIQITSLTLRAG